MGLWNNRYLWWRRKRSASPRKKLFAAVHSEGQVKVRQEKGKISHFLNINKRCLSDAD